MDAARFGPNAGGLSNLGRPAMPKPNRTHHQTAPVPVWRRWWRAMKRHWPWSAPPEIPEPLWRHVWQQQPFLHNLPPSAEAELQRLCRHFLAQKEFIGTHGLRITDELALTVALQACRPLLHWGLTGLRWYGDFVGLVIHPDEVVAQRQVTDEAGVVHRYRESLLGEAMAGGPVMLTRAHILGDTTASAGGHNLVIHEFAHKLDMRHKRHDQAADGCPRLPTGFLGLSARDARAHWRNTLQAAYRRFAQAVEMAERFGAPWPWLDAYGAQSTAEFFAVTCEAYFVNRPRLGEQCPELLPLYDAFFGPAR